MGFALPVEQKNDQCSPGRAIKMEPVEHLLSGRAFYFYDILEEKMLNKQVLMRSASRTTGLSLRETSTCIDSIIEALGDAISRGERVELRGFGSFFTRPVSQKKYPSSFSTQTVIPAHGRIVFRPSQKLRESVWKKVND
jgi:integration host factor subunit beta